jgi:hypothetical protein
MNAVDASPQSPLKAHTMRPAKHALVPARWCNKFLVVVIRNSDPMLHAMAASFWKAALILLSFQATAALAPRLTRTASHTSFEGCPRTILAQPLGTIAH